MNWTGTALAVMTLALGTSAGASPQELFGYGGRAPGMAGLGVASTADYDSVWTNPAGLAKVGTKRLTFGGLYGDFDLELDGSEQDVEAAAATTFGGVAPLRLGGVMEERLTLGIGVIVPRTAIARARWPSPGTPNFALLESRSQVVGLSVGLGARINDHWTGGISMLALAGLGGSIHLSANSAGEFSSKSEQTLVLDFAPILGTQYEAGRWRAGLTVRGESEATFDIRVSNDLENQLPLTIPTLFLQGTAQYDPLTVAVEAAYKIAPHTEVAAQLSYLRWSGFDAPTLSPIEGRPDPAAPDFSDTVVPRVGVEWSRALGGTQLTARSGYAFLMSPAPEMTGEQSLLDNHRHVLAAGFGIIPHKTWPVRIDLWTQYHWLMARTHTKDPSMFDANDMLPFDSIDTDGNVLVGGMTVGVDL